MPVSVCADAGILLFKVYGLVDPIYTYPNLGSYIILSKAFS